MANQRGLWVAALAGLLCAGGSPAAVMPLLTRIGATVTPAASEDTTIYKVVKNEEEQYNIWPADRVNKPGWTDAGKTGTKEECVAWINEVWTDMRPQSLRRSMEAGGDASQPAPAPVPASSLPDEPAPPAAEEPTAAPEAAADAEPEAEEEAEAEEESEPADEAAPEEAAEPEEEESEETPAEDESFADEEEAAEDEEESDDDGEGATEDPAA
jgi:MbtH protein